MSISGIQNNQYIPQISQTGNVASARGGDGDGDGGISSSGTAPGGRFASAIMQALSQAGISPSSTSTTASTSTQNPQQALQAFMQNLFAAMQTQGGQASGGTDSDGDSAASAISGSSSTLATGGQGHHHGGGVGKIEASLQGLIQQLSASGSSSSSSNATDTALQQSFQNLLNAQGQSNNSQAEVAQEFRTVR